MSGESINDILNVWTKRHGLRISDTYRNRFYYVDIIDDAGGKYEISVSVDAQPGYHKVQASSNRKGSCGYIPVALENLDGVLDRAYLRVSKWVEKAGGGKISAA